LKPTSALTAAGAALVALGLIAAPPAPVKARDLSEAARRIRADVETLTSDELAGRRAGTPGGEATARFLAGSFRKAGLLPAGDTGTYFQTFELIDTVDVGAKTSLTTAVGVPAGRTWKAGSDFRPLPFSAGGEAEGEVVFAGYGISAPELGWDDYSGLDVKGKVVLVLRYSPDGDDARSPFAPHTVLRSKASTARERGAVAVLFTTGPRTKGARDELAAVRLEGSFQDAGIPAVSVRRPVVEGLFPSRGRLESLQKRLDETRLPASVLLPGTRVSLVVEVTPRKARASNVVGVLPGSDREANTQVVVVGAHWDHLGNGASASLDPEGFGRLHPGADDNASGVAAILELARSFVPRRREIRRSLLFVGFGAEELGTLGSLTFVQHPPVPVDRIVAMVNLDMVGRLRSGRLEVHGLGTSPGWKPLLERAGRPPGLSPLFFDGGIGPSDATPFAAASRQVLYLFTGMHADYHRPSDTAATLNYEGIASIDSFLAPVLTALLNDETPLSRPVKPYVGAER
jgi:aminopeptidase YwaD